MGKYHKVKNVEHLAEINYWIPIKVTNGNFNDFHDQRIFPWSGLQSQKQVVK